MLRPILGFVLLTALVACKTTVPGPGWHHPEKPVGAYDYDYYQCRMIALQTTPQQTVQPAANSVYSQCYMIGNVQQCLQQQVPIYANQQAQPATPDPAWLARVDAQTGECLARQGWTRIGAPEAAAGETAAGK